MARFPRPRRSRIVVGAVVGSLVVAGIAGARAGLFARDHARAASVEDALKRFRDGEHAATRLEGVYLLDTVGKESLDVLGGAKHRYPATTTITVLRTACGLHLDWRALEGRGTGWELCSTPAGIELRSSAERHTFFWQSDTTRYACTGLLLTAAGEAGASGAPRPYTCTTLKGREEGETRTLGTERVTVGGTTVQAEHVHSESAISGANKGRETVDWWLDRATALPVRIVLHSRSSRHTIVGTAHYSEDADLRLTSLTPRR